MYAGRHIYETHSHICIHAQTHMHTWRRPYIYDVLLVHTRACNTYTHFHLFKPLFCSVHDCQCRGVAFAASIDTCWYCVGCVDSGRLSRRRTATVPLDPLGMRWNSYMLCNLPLCHFQVLRLDMFEIHCDELIRGLFKRAENITNRLLARVSKDHQEANKA